MTNCVCFDTVFISKNRLICNGEIVNELTFEEYMRVYLNMDLSDKENHQVINELEKQGCTIFYEGDYGWQKNNCIPVTDLGEEKSTLYDKMEAMILELPTQDPEIGFITAMGVMKKKPILFLLEKGVLIPEKLKELQQSEYGRYMTLIRSQGKLNTTRLKAIQQFLKKAKKGDFEGAMVKYTLRLPKELDLFLQKKSLLEKRSKAQIIREMIIRFWKD